MERWFRRRRRWRLGWVTCRGIIVGHMLSLITRRLGRRFLSFGCRRIIVLFLVSRGILILTLVGGRCRMVWLLIIWRRRVRVTLFTRILMLMVVPCRWVVLPRTPIVMWILVGGTFRLMVITRRMGGRLVILINIRMEYLLVRILLVFRCRLVGVTGRKRRFVPRRSCWNRLLPFWVSGVWTWVGRLFPRRRTFPRRTYRFLACRKRSWKECSPR